MNSSTSQNPSKQETENEVDSKVKIVTEIRTTIEDVLDLPTLPTIAHQMLGAVADQGGSLTRLVELIEMDVALTGKILRIANSAYFGVPRKVSNLKMALVVIGMEEISNLVTTASILKVFPSYSDASSFGTKFWFHNAAVAELTVGLYDALSLTKPHSAYVTSLLHDIGRLILFEYFRHYHQQIEELLAREKTATYLAEMQVIGVDHGHIGGWLLERWNLPEEIVKGVAQHHLRPDTTPPYSLPVMIDRANEAFYLMENYDEEGLTEFMWNDIQSVLNDCA